MAQQKTAKSSTAKVMSDAERALVASASVLKRGVLRKITKYGAKVKGSERYMVKLQCGHTRNARPNLTQARCRKCDRPRSLVAKRDTLLRKAADITARYNGGK
jgi:hypothetical protein